MKIKGIEETSDGTLLLSSNSLESFSNLWGYDFFR